MPADSPITPRSVLSYLERMAERCRRAHRPDLESDYQDAWEEAAAKIYGPLPPRMERRAIPPTPGELVPRPLKPGQREALERPLRKIIARDGDYEILECGHRVWSTAYDGSITPKRRRCRDCAAIARDEQNKKPAASADAANPKKGALA